jgi:hypothetical protein
MGFRRIGYSKGADLRATSFPGVRPNRRPASRMPGYPYCAIASFSEIQASDNRGIFKPPHSTARIQGVCSTTSTLAELMVPSGSGFYLASPPGRRREVSVGLRAAPKPRDEAAGGWKGARVLSTKSPGRGLLVGLHDFLWSAGGQGLNLKGGSHLRLTS